MKLFIKTFLLFILIIFVHTGHTKNPCFPNHTSRLVYDLVGFLAKNELNSLETKLRLINDTANVQVAIIITDTLCGMEISMYANQLGEQWGVGHAKYDNGIIIVVKPKYGKAGKGEIFIAPGRGIQGELPDAIIKRIINKIIIYEFKKGHFYEGLTKGIDAMLIRLSGRDFDIPSDAEGAGIVATLFFLLVAGFILGIVLSGGVHKIEKLIRGTILLGIDGMFSYFATGKSLSGNFFIALGTITISSLIGFILANMGLIPKPTGRSGRTTNERFPNIIGGTSFAEQEGGVEFGGGRFNGGGSGGTW